MKKFLLISTIVMSGCAQWMPANVTDLENGMYEVSASGNSFASIESMKEKIEKKASKLCSNSGFEYVESPTLDWHKQTDYSTGITTSYKVMSSVIKCDSKP